MSAAPAPSQVPARGAAAGKVAATAAPSDVWVRSLPLWHVWNIATIVVATALALISWSMTVEARVAAVALAGLLLALYVAMFMRRPGQWGWWLDYAVPYAAAVAVCFGILLQLNPYFAYLEFSLYPQVFFLLYARRSAVAVGACGLAIALTLSELTLYGWRLDYAAPHVFSDLVQIAFGFVISLWIGAIARQSLERRQLIDELERTRRQLAAAEREEGVLEERSRLAREIHDTLAQGFASVVTHLEAADVSLDTDPPRARHHVQEAEGVARTSLAEARGLAWALRPDALAGGGLPGAIERVAAAAAQGGPPTDVTVTGTVRPLHPDVEVTLLRATQEALANVRRHAQAGHVTATLSYFPDEVTLDVADDGRGFDPAAQAPGPAGGLGLLGMRERAEALGGSVAIESAPGEGTTVAVSLPAPASAPAPKPELVAP
ncbi:MAG: sensor histidine kinase [Candidatus Limnocylindrales bacterium]